MANWQEQSVPEYVRELSYQVATAVEIGALAIGVGRHEVSGSDPTIIFEVTEVIAPGVGKNATSQEAKDLRLQYVEADGSVNPVIAGSQQMFAEFKAGIIASEFDELLGTSASAA